MFGKIHGRFFLQQDLGISSDDTLSTFTLSELIETYPHWQKIVEELRNDYDTVNLCTMFETNDVHPDIIDKMKLFDEVIVPYDYLKDILLKHGVKCKALNYWTSSLIRSKPEVIHKTRDPSKLIFLYNGTNDIRKNVTTLTKPYPGVIDALSGFKARGIKLGICTNKPNDLANKICVNLDIAKYFDVICGSVANKPKKPDPYLLKSCVNAMECNLDEIAYVGDSTIDFDTAMNASINFYLFSGGYLNRPYPNFHKCIQFNDWKNIIINYNS